MLVEKIEHFGRKNRTFSVEKSNILGWEKSIFPISKIVTSKIFRPRNFFRSQIFFDLEKFLISKNFRDKYFSNPKKYSTHLFWPIALFAQRICAPAVRAEAVFFDVFRWFSNLNPLATSFILSLAKTHKADFGGANKVKKSVSQVGVRARWPLKRWSTLTKVSGKLV